MALTVLSPTQPSAAAQLTSQTDADGSIGVNRTRSMASLDRGRGSVFAKSVNEALFKPMEQFYFMAPGSKRIHGLRKWSNEDWVKYMTKYPAPAETLILFGTPSLFEGDDRESEVRKMLDRALEHRFDAEMASEVRARLAEPLPLDVWEAVLIFQNEVLYFEGEIEGRIEGAAAENGVYMDPALLHNVLFDREFPLGVEEVLMREHTKFALTHSGGGFHKVQYRKSNGVSAAIYGFIVFGIVFLITYLIARMTPGDPNHWVLEATIQDTSAPDYASAVALRGRSRGRVASLLNAMTFSLVINASLDKFGLIDPSTSTVLIGMTLGGTWGFVLDNIFGSDEGFREYLWSPQRGMWYAMGCLLTERFYRYIVTILFDMFFTVILFKHLYSKLVKVAGFSVKGREWIANGFISAVISVLTFEVYANMTRFQWAYPSGTESVQEQWVSGPTMVLCAVIMNMVYLTSETRTRVGEPGINSPNVKLCITGFTFVLLWLLSSYDAIDPSNWDSSPAAAFNASGGGSVLNLNASNVHLPLRDVCLTAEKGFRGFLFFLVIAVMCLGFVIFVTSAQSMSGLKVQCGCKKANGGDKRGSKSGYVVRNGPQAGKTPTSMTASRQPQSMEELKESMHEDTRVGRNTRPDRILAQCCLFFTFLIITVLIVAVFSVVPLYSADTAKYGQRDEALWKAACYDSYDKDALAALGLS